MSCIELLTCAGIKRFCSPIDGFAPGGGSPVSIACESSKVLYCGTYGVVIQVRRVG